MTQAGHRPAQGGARPRIETVDGDVAGVRHDQFLPAIVQARSLAGMMTLAANDVRDGLASPPAAHRPSHPSGAGPATAAAAPLPVMLMYPAVVGQNGARPEVAPLCAVTQ